MPHGLMEALFPVKSQNHSRVPNVRQMLGHDCRNDIWSRVQVWSLAWLRSFKTGSITYRSSESLNRRLHWPDACSFGRVSQSQWVIYEGDSNVSNAIRYFACNVGARVFCVPRCRRADSPSVDIRGDFFSGALLQASQRGLKAVPRLDLGCFEIKASLRWTYICRYKDGKSRCF